MGQITHLLGVVGRISAGKSQLAAVAAIRTALNFFLAREIREERKDVQARAGRAAEPSMQPEV